MGQRFRAVSLASVEEFESVPLSLRQLPRHTYEVFQRSADQFPDKVALRFLLKGQPGETALSYSYRELLQRITQTANALYHLGVRRSDAISILMPNFPQYHFALWGAEAAGIANPINPLLEMHQIIDIMNAAKSTVLITLAPWTQAEIWQKVPSLKAILTVNVSNVSPALEANIFDFDALIAKQRHDVLEHGQLIQSDDVASYFHTGGTTGLPKLAIHTHHNQVFSAWMVGKELDWKSSDVMHCGLPLFHVNAPLITGLAPFTVGGEVILTSPLGFRSEEVIKNFWDLVAEYKISFFIGVPTVYQALNKTWTDRVDTSSLRFAACGAAPMPVALMEAFQQRTRISIIEGYGLTEGTVFSTVNPAFGERYAGSIGLRIPYQQMKVVIFNDDGQYVRDAEVNEVGVIVIKGPNVFKGYLRERDNEAIWVQDGWLNTGDVGRQDERGYFWLTGRRKDLIIRGGHNIDPRVIEEALSQHPAVMLAAAVGKPDIKVGELPVAYVVLHEGQSVSERGLIDFIAPIISERAARPKNIYFIQKMPLTAVGKIFKPSLRADAIRRVFTEVLQGVGIEAEVAVEQDPKRGQVARIKVGDGCHSPALNDQIAALLGGYAIPYDLTQFLTA